MSKPDRSSQLERFVICFGQCQAEVWAEEKFRVRPLTDHERFAEVVGRVRTAIEKHFDYRFSDEEFTALLDCFRDNPRLNHILREASESEEDHSQRVEDLAAKRESDAAWRKIENSEWGPIGCIAVAVVVVVAFVGYLVYEICTQKPKPELTGVAKVPVWLDQLRGDDEVLRQEAVAALVKLGPEAHEAVSPLLDLMSDKRAKVRLAAITVLGAINNEHVRQNTSFFIRARSDDDPAVRAAAIRVDEEIFNRPPHLSPVKPK